MNGLRKAIIAAKANHIKKEQHALRNHIRQGGIFKLLSGRYTHNSCESLKLNISILTRRTTRRTWKNYSTVIHPPLSHLERCVRHPRIIVLILFNNDRNYSAVKSILIPLRQITFYTEIISQFWVKPLLCLQINLSKNPSPVI